MPYSTFRELRDEFNQYIDQRLKSSWESVQKTKSDLNTAFACLEQVEWGRLASYLESQGGREPILTWADSIILLQIKPNVSSPPNQNGLYLLLEPEFAEHIWTVTKLGSWHEWVLPQIRALKYDTLQTMLSKQLLTDLDKKESNGDWRYTAQRLNLLQKKGQLVFHRPGNIPIERLSSTSSSSNLFDDIELDEPEERPCLTGPGKRFFFTAGSVFFVAAAGYYGGVVYLAEIPAVAEMLNGIVEVGFNVAPYACAAIAGLFALLIAFAIWKCCVVDTEKPIQKISSPMIELQEINSTTR